MLIAIVGNALFLWDLRNAIKVERWIESYKHTVKKWFEVIAFFDAENSLANFCFNHPAYTFPKIIKGKSIIRGTQLGHPLLKSALENSLEFVDKGRLLDVPKLWESFNKNFSRSVNSVGLTRSVELYLYFFDLLNEKALVLPPLLTFLPILTLLKSFLAT